MAETADRFYVRRTTGDLVGPVTKAAIAGLLQEGKLDGSEEVSPDRRRWQPIGALIPEALPPPPAAAPDDSASSTWGERDLGGGSDLELAPVDTAFGQSRAAPFASPEPASADPDVARPPGLAPVDLESLAPLELEAQAERAPPAAATAAAAQTAPVEARAPLSLASGDTADEPPPPDAS